MYTLYTRAGSGGFAAEAALSMAGVPFTTVEVKRGPPDDAFRGISPLGQVPVLTLPDGSSITESAAICILDRRAVSRGGAIAGAGLARPCAVPALDAVHVVGALSGAAALLLRRALHRLRPTAWPRSSAYALAESDRAFGILDAALEDRDWLVGDRHSIADVYLLMLGCWHPVNDRPREEWTNLVRHAAALKQLPALAALNASSSHVVKLSVKPDGRAVVVRPRGDDQWKRTRAVRVSPPRRAQAGPGPRM